MSNATETVQKVNTADRRIETDFRILDTARQDPSQPEELRAVNPREEWATLRVVTWHDPQRKAYVSRVRRMMTNALGGYSMTFNLMHGEPDPAPVEILPTGRYNAGKLGEVHDRYLSQHLGAGSQIDAAIEWARAAVSA